MAYTGCRGSSSHPQHGSCSSVSAFRSLPPCHPVALYQPSACPSTCRKQQTCSLFSCPSAPLFSRRGPAPARFTSKYGDSVFADKHAELQTDPYWYTEELAQHVTPASLRATRSDVRLVQEFTKYLRMQRLELKGLFCSERLLSGDLSDLCEIDYGEDAHAASNGSSSNGVSANSSGESSSSSGNGSAAYGEGRQVGLLSEYLTSGGGLRVGERLPNWFAAGNLRGGIKVWMALRMSQPKGSLAQHTPCQELQAAAWDHSWVSNLGGWEADPARKASKEDVELLERFAALVRSRRLDVAPFLERVARVDPFSWCMAQVAQGSISEPVPWLLEQFFLCSHQPGGPLPLWFTSWGTRDALAAWFDGPEARAWEQELQAASAAVTSTSQSMNGKGNNGRQEEESEAAAAAALAVAAGSLDEGTALEVLLAAAAGAQQRQLAAERDVAVEETAAREARERLRIAAEAALTGRAGSSRGVVAAPAEPLPDALGSGGYAAADATALARDVALVAVVLRPAAAAAVAVRRAPLAAAAGATTASATLQQQQQQGPGMAAAAAARKAKEVLDYSAWLLLQAGSSSYEPGQVIRLAVWPGPGQPPEGVCRYLSHYGVKVMCASEISPAAVAAVCNLRQQQQQRG